MSNPFFDSQIAGNYDKWYDSYVGKIYDKLEKKKISNIIKNKRKGYLLDVGCGTGHWSKYFSDLGFKVTGIDNSMEMIEIAQRKKIKNCEFLKVEALNFEADKKYNAASFITSLEFMENYKKIIKNIVKYLRDDGYIILGVLNENSYLSRQRKKEKNIYSGAHFFTFDKLKNLFSSYGNVKLKGCVYPSPNFIRYYKIIEYIGKILNLKNSNFIAGKVDL